MTKKVASGLFLSATCLMLLAGCLNRQGSGSTTPTTQPTTTSQYIPPEISSSTLPPETSTSYMHEVYKVNVIKDAHVTVNLVDDRPTSGSEVTFSISFDASYQLKTIDVKNDTTSLPVRLEKVSEGNYKFIMPDSEVTLSVYSASQEPYAEYQKTQLTQRYELGGYKNAIGDETFRKGFMVRKKWNDTSVVPTSYTYTNRIKQYDSLWSKKPSQNWEITQWMSNSCIDPDTDNGYVLETGDGNFKIRDNNSAKILNFDTKTGTFKFDCNCSKEYPSNAQEFNPYYGGKWWVHCLIEQSLPQPVKLSECDSIILSLDYDVKSCGGSYGMTDGSADCAQAEWYITIQDSTNTSKYAWFGFDLFDSRNQGKVTKEYRNGEFGSGVRILRPGSDVWSTINGGKTPFGVQPYAGSTGKVTVNYQGVIDFVKDDFAKNSYWTGVDYNNLVIGATNIGYEIHSHRDLSVEFSNWGIYYHKK